MKVSRAQVARELSRNLKDVNRTTIIDQSAAWLVNSGKQRQAKYLAQDVARILVAEQGYVLASVTTARSLDEQQVESLKDYVLSMSGGRDVEFIYSIDPKVIGGVRIETPVGTLDGTVRHQLENLVRGMNE